MKVIYEATIKITAEGNKSSTDIEKDVLRKSLQDIKKHSDKVFLDTISEELQYYGRLLKTGVDFNSKISNEE